MYNRKARCPLHAERTGSFWFYPETNSWNCFGCKRGGRAVDFVAARDGIERIDAAVLIIKEFGELLNQSPLVGERRTSEYDRDLLAFSALVRRQYVIYREEPDKLLFIENLLYSYDKIIGKHDLSHESLQALIVKVKRRMEVNGITCQ